MSRPAIMPTKYQLSTSKMKDAKTKAKTSKAAVTTSLRGIGRGS